MNVELSITDVVAPATGISEAELAPFCLLRVAALPYDTLEAMRLPETEARITAILAAEHAMEAVRQELEDATHDLVPRLAPEAKALRRALLKLRRDIHNGRPTNVRDGDLDEIGSQLPPQAAECFSRWRQAQRTCAEALAALESGMRGELQSITRPALRAPLAVATFRRGLAFGSPGVARAAAHEKRLPNPPRPDNLERSLLGYLNRAAAKTSPFSSFMALAVLPVEPAVTAGVPGAPAPAFVSRTRSNRGVFSRLYRAALDEAAAHGDVVLSLNPTAAEAPGGRITALCDREAVMLGRPWSDQRLAQFRLPQGLVAALLQADGPASLGEWRARLEAGGASASQAEMVADKLVERGLLLPPPLLDAFDDAPEHTLAAAWARSRSPRLQRLSRTVAAMGEAAAAVATQEGAQQAGHLTAIRDGEASALSDLGQAHEPLHNMVLEDCWLSGVEGSIGASLLEPLRDLQSFLATQVIVSPYYRRLRDRFVAEFGSGGTCNDVVGFLVRVGDKLLDLPELGARIIEPASSTAPAGVAIPATAQVQVDAGDGSRPPRVVVNRVFDGAGWLAARFTQGDQPQQAFLRDSLRAWLRQVSHPREPVDLVLSGQCNDLQAHARLTDRVLQWPGEPVLAPAAEVVHAGSLRLSHNPASDLLELHDGDGTAINLVYLGATLPSPIWGVRYALSILSQPYLLRRPDFGPPAQRSHDTISCEPPLVRGNLVLRRRTWWLSREYMQREWFQGSESERLLQVRRDCERHGIPLAVFAQRHITSDRRGLMPADLLNANRKPIWVDLRNPFWLAMLERVAEEAEWVFLSEPLPGSDGLWFEVEGRRHVTEMQLEMVVRSAPDG